MKHVLLRRRALIVALLVALLSTVAGVTAQSASAQTLAPGGTINFAGQFDLGVAPVEICPAETINLGLLDCRYFTFEVAATVAPGSLATITITTTEEGFTAADAKVFCRPAGTDPAFGEDRTPVPASSTGGMTSEAIQFVVNPGEICEIRVGTPFPGPAGFRGTVTLGGTTGSGGSGGGGTGLVSVSGGGKIDPQKTFTSSAKPARDGKPAQGNWRYFNKITGCTAYATVIYTVTGASGGSGGNAHVTGRLKVKSASGAVTEVDFTSDVVDGGEGNSNSADTYSIASSSCANESPNTVDSGNIQTHPAQ